jgi:release factor glutamine methyltransferase
MVKTTGNLKQYALTHIGPYISDMMMRYGPRKVNVLGQTYVLRKDVCNPRFLGISEFMAQNISVRPEDEVLDMGTGSGILAITAAKTARRVVAVDINNNAVVCAKENAKRNGADNITFLQGDLFSALSDDIKFDVILVHPPFTEGKEEGNNPNGKYNVKKSFARQFFKEAREHIRPQGYSQIIYPSYAGMERVLDIAREHGWIMRLYAKKKGLFMTFCIFRGTLNPEDY